MRGIAAEQPDGRVLRVHDQLAGAEAEAEQRPRLDRLDEVGPDDVAARHVVRHAGDAVEGEVDGRAEREQAGDHAAHRQVHLPLQREDLPAGEQEDDAEEERHRDQRRAGLGQQQDGEVEAADDQPLQLEAAQVFQRRGEDGGDAEAAEEGRRVHALEAAADIEPGPDPGGRGQHADHAR